MNFVFCYDADVDNAAIQIAVKFNSSICEETLTLILSLVAATPWHPDHPVSTWFSHSSALSLPRAKHVLYVHEENQHTSGHEWYKSFLFWKNGQMGSFKDYVESRWC